MKKTAIITIVLLIAMSLTAQTTFTKTQTTTLPNPATEGDAPYAIASEDVDNDGFVDLVIGTYLGGAIFWYKNDGLGNFSIQPTITNTLGGIVDIVLVDIDGDTSIDILATSFTNDKLVYYPNSVTNPGTFGAEQIISSALDGAGDIEVELLNGDAFLDVAVSAFNANKIVWFANDGSGNFGIENNITNAVSTPGSFDMMDIDNDSDLDLVVSNSTTIGQNTSVLEVFYNNALTFTKDVNSVTTTNDYSFNVSFQDIDASNNTGITSDILATDLYGNLMHYNKETDGTYTETVIPTSIPNPATIGFYDLDLSGDGLKDIILSSGAQTSASDLVWYKNNGAGNFSAETVIDATQNNAFKFVVADFDNDNDLDIASIAYGDDQVVVFNNQKFALGVDDNSLKSIKIFPNPVTTELFIKSTNVFNDDFLIYDLLGKKLLEGIASNTTPINIVSLKKGMYFLKLKNSSTTHKFLKE